MTQHSFNSLASRTHALRFMTRSPKPFIAAAVSLRPVSSPTPSAVSWSLRFQLMPSSARVPSGGFAKRAMQWRVETRCQPFRRRPALRSQLTPQSTWHRPEGEAGHTFDLVFNPEGHRLSFLAWSCPAFPFSCSPKTGEALSLPRLSGFQPPAHSIRFAPV
jgi:hypothetical protein